MPNIKENIEIVRHRILQACNKTGRSSENITLMAVSKTVDVSRIKTAYEAGIRVFGENKVQEAGEKISALPAEVVFHMIGHLQTNKAKDALKIFKMIQSVDSLRLAQRLQRLLEEKNKKMDILLEVNIGGENSKFGFLDNEIIKAHEQISNLKNLNIRGLMTVAPFSENSEDVRIYFRKMKKLFDQIGNLSILSMGMSHDFSVAIEEGATMIRVGEAIFGKRGV